MLQIDWLLRADHDVWGKKRHKLKDLLSQEKAWGFVDLWRL